MKCDNFTTGDNYCRHIFCSGLQRRQPQGDKSSPKRCHHLGHRCLFTVHIGVSVGSNNSLYLNFSKETNSSSANSMESFLSQILPEEVAVWSAKSMLRAKSIVLDSSFPSLFFAEIRKLCFPVPTLISLEIARSLPEVCSSVPSR